ncbi:family 2 encapsulin nanocompartment cargo protein terpene cyclase [Actinomadura montaniterrae]|uniref:family 2 encapsulin nanocompartment cargo protein terpene cyclase n=1 Tax=Actinomadura montaniterrae TaxID=1803903 RepID=UPI001CEF7A57|nr:family 2 encapsulin nanocompartment cargo protein terpene cyclase [Actinomadura montaniterrae]
MDECSVARGPGCATDGPAPEAEAGSPDGAAAGRAAAERVSRLLSGPSGLGTSAARILDALRTVPPPTDAPAPPPLDAPEAPAAQEPDVLEPDPPAPDAPDIAEPDAAEPGVPDLGAHEPPEPDAALPVLPTPLPSPTRKGGHFSPGYAERPWGDGSFPPLYCPLTARIDDDLALVVNDRLVEWADEVGIYADQLDKFRNTGFGRLAVLAHPETDDVDPLLLAAKMNAAWWACDDYYADESDLGATPTELPPRLALVMSAMDPPPDAGKYTVQVEGAVESDPVLRALRSATAHLKRHAGPSQVMRILNTTFQMYVSWTAYAAWRHLGELPPVWRYLAARQHDSFYTSMTLIDVVGGYQLDANLFYEPRVHRAVMQAGTASVIVNDLHSVEREAADDLPDCNVVLLIAEEEGCPLEEAVRTAVAMHNDFVRGFEDSQRELASVPSAELQRFLLGVQSWMGGCLEWHGASDRYK